MSYSTFRNSRTVVVGRNDGKRPSYFTILMCRQQPIVRSRFTTTTVGLFPSISVPER
jgi:hypothetical protein